MWSRNLGHLFVSPLRPYELIISLVVMSFIRTIIGIVPASLLAIAFFGFSVYSLGLSLIVFFVNLLLMGWAIGFAISGLVLRFGLGAESRRRVSPSRREMLREGVGCLETRRPPSSRSAPWCKAKPKNYPEGYIPCVLYLASELDSRVPSGF